jgi:hypothetical protein
VDETLSATVPTRSSVRTTSDSPEISLRFPTEKLQSNLFNYEHSGHLGCVTLCCWLNISQLFKGKCSLYLQG